MNHRRRDPSRSSPSSRTCDLRKILPPFSGPLQPTPISTLGLLVSGAGQEDAKEAAERWRSVFGNPFAALCRSQAEDNGAGKSKASLVETGDELDDIKQTGAKEDSFSRASSSLAPLTSIFYPHLSLGSGLPFKPFDARVLCSRGYLYPCFFRFALGTVLRAFVKSLRHLRSLRSLLGER